MTTAVRLGPSPTPRGREEVRAALLEAAATLFAERGPASVSVRDVAARAGVNHGLVHRHFGSKEALLRATVDRFADQMAAALDDDAVASDLSSLAEREDLDLDRFWRVLARALLDGAPPEQLQDQFPLLDRLVMAARREPAEGAATTDARVDVLLGVALELGLMLFGPYLRHGLHLDAEEDRVQSASRDAWATLLTGAYTTKGHP